MAAILDDSISSALFGVEAILPIQFWGAGQKSDRGQPERRLMLAVLQDALLTLVVHAKQTSGKSRQTVQDTWRWFASDSRSHPFAFGAICDVLGLDVGYLRSAVRRLQKTADKASYRRDYAGRGRHQVERLARSRA